MENADSETHKKGHWLAAAADVRANLVRMIAILGFYTIHLINVYLPGMGDTLVKANGESAVAPSVHLIVSMIVFAWLMQALGVHLATMTKPFSRKIALAITCGDSVWLTAALCFSTGAAGPMVAGYFLIIGLAALRLELQLIRWSDRRGGCRLCVCFGSNTLASGIAWWPEDRTCTALSPVDDGCCHDLDGGCPRAMHSTGVGRRGFT